MRRVYIVESKFQWTVVIYTFAISLLTSIVHITISQLIAIDHIQQLTSLSMVNVGPKLAIAGIIVFLYLCIFIIAILFSNRLAGPLYRLRRHMKDVAEGKKTPRLSFRKNDYYSNLQESYNNLLESKVITKNEKGLSLLEVMMVLAITGALSAMGAAIFYNRTQARMSFHQEVDNLQSILNTARNAAMNLNQCTRITRIDSRTMRVTSYALPFPCTPPLPAPSMTAEQVFGPNTTISEFNTGTTLTFRPGGGTTLTQPATITLDNQDNRATFTIYPAIGQIRYL